MQEPRARQYELKTNAEFVVSRLAPLRRLQISVGADTQVPYTDLQTDLF